MRIEYALVLVLSMVFAFILWYTKGKFRTSLGWTFIFLILGSVVGLRSLDIITYFQVWSLYGVLVTTNYLVVYLVKKFFFKDLGETSNLSEGEITQAVGGKVVHFCIATKDEDTDSLRTCIKSIVRSAESAARYGITTYITLVDDASRDSSAARQIAAEYKDYPHLRVIFLGKNEGKKGALTVAALGKTTDWELAYRQFKEKYDRPPGRGDAKKLIEIFKSNGYEYVDSDVVMHTDSDSRIEEKFILAQVYVFATNENVGACSGACDVNITEENKHNFWVMLQVAWYFTQFYVRKAAESAVGGGFVFCVSGPVAAFRTEAIIPVLHKWARWEHRGKVFKGATDRTLTLLILMMGYNVVFTPSARGYTNVPESLGQLRKQWTRWKTNFWHVLIPVAKFAWKTHPVVAFLTYSRLFLTVVGPFVMIDHLANAMNGDLFGVIIYFAGIMLMGGLMGVAYMQGAENPSLKYAGFRPIISLFSSIIGSTWTLEALQKTLAGTFTWREAEAAKKDGWLRTILNPELVKFMFFVAIVILIALIRRLQGT